MSERDGNGDGSVDAERLRRLRLGEFLRDLVRQEGRMEAAELLGVNYRTLVKAEESGELTGRKGQTSWRRKALADTRVALRKRELLRWVRRILTLGLWRR